MKKLYLTLSIFIYSLHMNAQNVFPSSGNVGMGTLTPAYPLHIKKNSLAPAMSIGGGLAGSPRLQIYGLEDDPNGWMGFGTDMSGGPYEHSIYFPSVVGENVGKLTIGDYNGSIYHPKIWIYATGNVGIGSPAPQALLHVSTNGSSINASNQYTGDMIIQGSPGVRSPILGASLEFVIPANTDGSNAWGQGRIATVAGNDLSSNATGKMIFGTRRSFDKGTGSGWGWNYGDDIVIDGAGRVGIGTAEPKETLSVNGNIRSKEIKVETTNWPDYVFDKSYELTDLKDLKYFIDQNHHLPDIPTESEILKNGLNVGEINKQLLKKVEELTLYLINNNSLITEQAQKNKELAVQLLNRDQLIEEQEKRLQKLEFIMKDIMLLKDN